MTNTIKEINIGNTATPTVHNTTSHLAYHTSPIQKSSIDKDAAHRFGNLYVVACIIISIISIGIPSNSRRESHPNNIIDIRLKFREQSIPKKHWIQ